MRSLEEFVLAKCLIFVVASITTTPPAPNAQQYDGQIVGVRSHDLTITMRTYQCTFAVEDETQITLDGKPAQLADLPVGAPVAVIAKSGENDPIATRIKARTGQQTGLRTGATP